MRLWVNPKSVILGYTLDVCEEVDCRAAEYLEVPVVRRFTGGGAVYHDEGNLNLSIVVPGALGIAEIYGLGTGIVLGALRALGLEARVENASDVVIGGYKVSGSAATIRPRASLFHATLLVRADVGLLKALVKPRLDRVERGEVTPSKYNPGNLSYFAEISVYRVAGLLASSAAERLGLEDLEPACLPLELGSRALELYSGKYSTRAWSPIGPVWLERPRCGLPGW